MEGETAVEVTIETHVNGLEAYVVDGEKYPAWESDTPEAFLRLSRHYAIIAEYLESPENREQRRLRARRDEIAKRHGIGRISRSSEPIRSMIEDILNLEEAQK